MEWSDSNRSDVEEDIRRRYQTLSQTESNMEQMKKRLSSIYKIDHTTIQFECANCGHRCNINVNRFKSSISCMELVILYMGCPHKNFTRGNSIL